MNSFFFHCRRSFASLFTSNFKVFYFIVALLIATGNSVLSQAPLAIPYQAVARTSSGNLIINQLVKVRFSIRDGSISGTIVYRETHSPTTNALGLFSVNIGGGTVVTGTMASINWGNGAKYLQVELDPAGGSSYINMGTSQMMSVPYALSARTVEQNGGKTYITLTGAVTDAQAAAIMIRDVGPNTQFVTIINTTNLTTVNLSGITELMNLNIQNTTGLTTVNLGHLTKVYENILIKANQNLASFSAPLLQEAYGNIDIISNGISSSDGLTSVDLGALTTATAERINIESNPALTSVDLGSLVSPPFQNFFLSNNTSLTSVDLGNLPSIPSGPSFIFSGNDALATLNLDNLNSIEGTFIIKYSPLLPLNLNNLDTVTGFVRIFGTTGTTFSAQNLKYISGTFWLQGGSLTSIDLDAVTSIDGDFMVAYSDNLTVLKLGHLTSVRGSFNVNSLPSLVSLNLGSLSSIAGEFQISDNKNLSSLALSGLASISDGGEINLSQCGFTSAGVNSLLARLVNALPFTGRNINLTTFSSTAPPTGQGITDKNTLISNGNIVTTD
jgi:hypothetical protein